MPRKDEASRKEYVKEYYANNKEKFLVWRIANRDRRRLIAAQKRAATAAVSKPIIKKECKVCAADITEKYKSRKGLYCETCFKDYMRAYREENKEKIAAQKKAWSIRNFEHKAAQDRGYAQQNPEKRREARLKWAKANPGLDKAAKQQNYVERKLRRPNWLSEDDAWMISEVYELAAVRTELFGFSWHVDHIVPLKGKLVSGLHVPHNLQVIPWVENLRKGAKFDGC